MPIIREHDANTAFVYQWRIYARSPLSLLRYTHERGYDADRKPGAHGSKSATQATFCDDVDFCIDFIEEIGLANFKTALRHLPRADHRHAWIVCEG